MNAFKVWLQKRTADPSAAWRDLLNTAKEAATTVDEQKASGVQQLVRVTFVEESAYEKYYKGKTDYEPMFNKKGPQAIKGEKKMG